jgi:hypothetical protein
MLKSKPLGRSGKRILLDTNIIHYIVTRDPAGFTESPVLAVSPDEFLGLITG